MYKKLNKLEIFFDNISSEMYYIYNIISHITVKVKTSGLRLSDFMEFLMRLGNRHTYCVW